jgi:mono/diheme cytochrome c family protein
LSRHNPQGGFGRPFYCIVRLDEQTQAGPSNRSGAAAARNKEKVMMPGLRTISLAACLMACSGVMAQTPVERGGYLVNTIMACGNCHTPKGQDGTPINDRQLSGGMHFDTPSFDATASNITPDTETGIGTWSDADIKKLLTTGVRPNGVPAAAIMAVNFYKLLTPGDLDAIVAYLRSVPAVKNTVPLPIYKQEVRRTPYPDAENPITEEAMKDPVVRGRYLAAVGHCMECHTPFLRSVSDFSNGLGKGGREFPGPYGVSVSANITSSPKAGIGAVSDAEIKQAITQGIAPDGHKMKPPMAYAWYAHLTDSDVDALVAWLRTLPARE